MPCYCSCKERKKSNEHQIQYRTKSHPISETATSHVCELKRLEMRVIKIVHFSSEENEVVVSYILVVK